MKNPNDQAIWASDPIEGTPIVLCDKQTWIFPAPRLGNFRFRRTVDCRTLMARSFVWGDGYNALVDTYVDAEPGIPEAVAVFELAYYLLQINYRITFGDAAAILLRAEDEAPAQEQAENKAMWDAILEVALGRVPKPIVGG